MGNLFDGFALQDLGEVLKDCGVVFQLGDVEDRNLVLAGDTDRLDEALLELRVDSDHRLSLEVLLDFFEGFDGSHEEVVLSGESEIAQLEVREPGWRLGWGLLEFAGSLFGFWRGFFLLRSLAVLFGFSRIDRQ